MNVYLAGALVQTQNQVRNFAFSKQDSPILETPGPGGTSKIASPPESWGEEELCGILTRARKLAIPGRIWKGIRINNWIVRLDVGSCYGAAGHTFVRGGRVRNIMNSVPILFSTSTVQYSA